MSRSLAFDGSKIRGDRKLPGTTLIVTERGVPPPRGFHANLAQAVLRKAVDDFNSGNERWKKNALGFFRDTTTLSTWVVLLGGSERTTTLIQEKVRNAVERNQSLQLGPAADWEDVAGESERTDEDLLEGSGEAEFAFLADAAAQAAAEEARVA